MDLNYYNELYFKTYSKRPLLGQNWLVVVLGKSIFESEHAYLEGLKISLIRATNICLPVIKYIYLNIDFVFLGNTLSSDGISDEVYSKITQEIELEIDRIKVPNVHVAVLIDRDVVNKKFLYDAILSTINNIDNWYTFCSLPSFEYWLLLHLQDFTDLNRPLSKKMVLNLLIANNSNFSLNDPKMFILLNKNGGFERALAKNRNDCKGKCHICPESFSCQHSCIPNLIDKLIPDFTVAALDDQPK